MIGGKLARLKDSLGFDYKVQVFSLTFLRINRFYSIDRAKLRINDD